MEDEKIYMAMCFNCPRHNWCWNDDDQNVCDEYLKEVENAVK